MNVSGAENDLGGAFVNTGYGTYAGTGNVDSGAKEQKGTGYDAHGQVKTSFGKWHIDYDPVTGQATTGTTCDYHFPGQAMDLEAVTGELLQSFVLLLFFQRPDWRL